MKHLFFILSITLVSSVAAQTKVGYTNVELLMSYMPEAQSATTALEQYKRAKAKEISEMRSRYFELVDEYQQKTQQPNFSGSTEETDLINKVGSLEKEIEVSETNYDYDVQRKQSELLQPVLDKLQAAINAVAKENNYTYILNQTSGMNILYGVKQYDVTLEIAEKLGIVIPN